MGKKKTHEQFIEEVKLKNPNVIILEKYIKDSEKIKCGCKKNKKHIWLTTATNLIHKTKPTGCPYCCGQKILEEDSLYYKRPDLVKYFKNLEDTKIYGVQSGKKIEVICPDCGAKKKTTICNLVNQGFSCQKCKDNISKPNKFARNILRQLLEKKVIDFYELEYTPNFIKEINSKYKYDAFFRYNNKDYYQENQGKQHYTENGFVNNKEQQKERIKIDKIKKEKASKYANFIEIDCSESDFEFLKNKFINAYNKIEIDLNLYIDWKETENSIFTNIMKQICIYYEEHKPITIRELTGIFKIDRNVISKYLNKGTKLGFCNYIYKDNLVLGGKRSKPPKNKLKNSYNVQV